MTLRKSAPQTYHITTADPNHAMLTRYGILTPDDDLPLSDGEISQAGDIVTLAAGKREVQCRITPHTRGYRLELPLTLYILQVTLAGPRTTVEAQAFYRMVIFSGQTKKLVCKPRYVAAQTGFRYGIILFQLF